MCLTGKRGESHETGLYCKVGSNEGGNEGLGFQSCLLQVDLGQALETETARAEKARWVS